MKYCHMVGNEDEEEKEEALKWKREKDRVWCKISFEI